MDKNLLTDVVAQMPQEFDSHEFIKKFIAMHEREYVDMLYEQHEVNGIFRAVHAEIGRALAEDAERLNICKVTRDLSENVKGYDSENQRCKKC